MSVWVISGSETSTPSATTTCYFFVHPPLQSAWDKECKVGQSYLLLACTDSSKLFSPDPLTNAQDAGEPQMSPAVEGNPMQSSLQVLLAQAKRSTALASRAWQKIFSRSARGVIELGRWFSFAWRLHM